MCIAHVCLLKQAKMLKLINISWGSISKHLCTAKLSELSVMSKLDHYCRTTLYTLFLTVCLSACILFSFVFFQIFKFNIICGEKGNVLSLDEGIIWFSFTFSKSQNWSFKSAVLKTILYFTFLGSQLPLTMTLECF